MCYCDLLRLNLQETRTQVDIHHHLLKRPRHRGVIYRLLLGQDIDMLRPVVNHLYLQQIPY